VGHVVGLTGRDSKVPAVHDELVEGDNAGDLRREFQSPGGRDAYPRRGVPPRGRQRVDVAGDAVSPAGLEVRRIRTWRRAARDVLWLLRLRRERDGQRADVVDEIANCRVRARGGVAKLAVVDTGEEVHNPV